VEEERQLVQRLRDGDQGAFVELIDRYHSSLLRLARTFVPSDAVAEEVVQDTWLGVVRGIDRFEGRSSLKTWLFRILTNRARSTGVKESRSVPDEFEHEPAVNPNRFGFFGHWSSPPLAWDDVEQQILTGATVGAVYESLGRLPETQRRVLVLRDIEGLDSEEVCDILGITEGNQRVLLHRGRARIRQAVEDEFGAE
jgi:RNA polymerase sigma-70 factor (ECF subfamily)